MRIDSKVWLLLLGCSFITAACGQKGPLYLPGRSSTFESMIPEQAPVPQEESEEDDEADDEEQSENIN